MARRRTKAFPKKPDAELIANDQEGHCSPSQAALDKRVYKRLSTPG